MFTCHSNVSFEQNLATKPYLCLNDCPIICCCHCSCMCSSRLTLSYSDAGHQWVHQYWAAALLTLQATDMDERGWKIQHLCNSGQGVTGNCWSQRNVLCNPVHQTSSLFVWSNSVSGGRFKTTKEKCRHGTRIHKMNSYESVQTTVHVC